MKNTLKNNKLPPKNQFSLRIEALFYIFANLFDV